MKYAVPTAHQRMQAGRFLSPNPRRQGSSPSASTAREPVWQHGRAAQQKDDTKMKYRIDSREDWLNAAVAELRPMYEIRGYKVPPNVRVSVGYPLGRRAGGERISRCWTVANPRDGAYEVFISPMLDNDVKVLAALTHDLCHLAVGIDAAHRPIFAKCAASMGLESPWNELHEGEAFRAGVARPILRALEVPYPHTRLAPADTNSGPAKQGTRLVKCHCLACGYITRTTMKWLLTVGPPLCPTPGCDKQPMAMEGLSEV